MTSGPGAGLTSSGNNFFGRRGTCGESVGAGLAGAGPGAGPWVPKTAWELPAADAPAVGPAAADDAVDPATATEVTGSAWGTGSVGAGTGSGAGTGAGAGTGSGAGAGTYGGGGGE